MRMVRDYAVGKRGNVENILNNYRIGASIIFIGLLTTSIFGQTNSEFIPYASDTNQRVQLEATIQKNKRLANLGIAAHFLGPLILSLGIMEGDGGFSQLLAASGAILTVGGGALSCIAAMSTENQMRANGYQFKDPHILRTPIIGGIACGAGAIPFLTGAFISIGSYEQGKPFVITGCVCFSLGELAFAWTTIRSRIFIGNSIRLINSK